MSPSLKVLVICLKETGGELCLSFYTFFMTNQFWMLTVAPLNLGVLLQGSSGPCQQLPAEGVGGAWEEGESQGGEGGSQTLTTSHRRSHRRSQRRSQRKKPAVAGGQVGPCTCSQTIQTTTYYLNAFSNGSSSTSTSSFSFTFPQHHLTNTSSPVRIQRSWPWLGPHGTPRVPVCPSANTWVLLIRQWPPGTQHLASRHQ